MLVPSKKMIVVIALVTTIISCEKTHSNAEQTVNKVNIAEAVDRASQTLNLSDAVESIEIVPLEMTDKSMVGRIMEMTIDNENIFIKHNMLVGLLRFDKNGKYMNQIGKQGQGPDEIVRINNFFIDEKKKEVNLVSTIKGIQTYDFNGKHIRNNSKFVIEEVAAQADCDIYEYAGKYFMMESGQMMLSNADSLWQIALLDNDYLPYKKFFNPAHIGHEKDITDYPPSMTTVATSWFEETPTIDLYGNKLLLKYPDTDSIYSFIPEHDTFEPIYDLNFGNLPRTDYMKYNLINPREKDAYDNLRITTFYNTLQYIYLVGNIKDIIYTFRYDKENKEIQVSKRQGEFKRGRYQFSGGRYNWNLDRDFILNNDICGGQFRVDFTSGNYWVFVLTHEAIDEVLQLKDTSVKDAALYARLKDEVKRMEDNDDANPVLLVAKLK